MEVKKTLRSPPAAVRYASMERVAGLEPASTAWKAVVIALIRYPREESIRYLPGHFNQALGKFQVSQSAK